MKILSIVLFLFVFIIGCVVNKTSYDYNISAKNIGETKLRNVTITSDKGLWHGTGYLNKGAVKTLGGYKSWPPNGVYTIVVETMDKQASKAVVDLQDKIEKDFRGEIVFLVDEKNNLSYTLE